MAGQSISDRLIAAQHSLLGSDMAKGVCKATTTEALPPKKKHLDYLLELTHQHNINIPDLINCLVERTKSPKWVVVFKALITAHHLMSHGSEKVMQHVASRNGLFRLEVFIDKSEGSAYDMSTCIRRYANYLNQKALSYRAVAYDFTRIPRGGSGPLRTKEIDSLLKALPALQQQIDGLVDFNPNPQLFHNSIIKAAFRLMFKDLIRLFACYNDGIINLLEKYFSLRKSQCKEGLDVYRKFLVRMNKIAEMLKMAEQVGIDRSDIPDLSVAPNSLLESLEQHFASLKEDSKIVSTKHPPLHSLNALSTNLHKIEEKISSHKQGTTNSLQNQFSTSDSQSAVKEKDSVTSADLFDIFGDSSVISSSLNGPFDTQASHNIQTNFFSLDGSTKMIHPMQSGKSATLSSVSDPFLGISQYGSPASTFSNPVSALENKDFGNVFNFDQTNNQAGPDTKVGISSQNDINYQGHQPPVHQTLQPIREIFSQKEDASSRESPLPSNQNLESSLACNVANLSIIGQKANLNFEPVTEKKLTGGANYDSLVFSSPTTMNPNPMIPSRIGMVSQMTSGFPTNASNVLFQQQPTASFGNNVANPMSQPLVPTNQLPLNVFGGNMSNLMTPTMLQQTPNVFGNNLSNPMTQQQQTTFNTPQQTPNSSRPLSPNNPFGNLL